MIYPSTVPLQEVITFTYRAPVFDLPGRGLGGLTLPLQEDDLPIGTCLGVGFDPPQKGSRSNWTKRGVQKKFLLVSLADYLCPNV